MRPRTSLSIIRALPAWATLCLLTAISTAALAACGSQSGGSSPTPQATVTVTATPSAPPSSPSPSPTAAATTTMALYFLRGEELGVAQRRAPLTPIPATAAIRTLLAGPTTAERAAGLTSAIPHGVHLLGLSLEGTTARIDLSARFAAGGGSLSMQARVAQVVYTLTRFRTIKAVDFMLDGSPVETLDGEGLVFDMEQTRAAWRRFEPAIFVETPGVGATLSSPFTISGTASVFEGSFRASLVDAGGGKIASATIQASRGAPGRGRYREVVTFGAAEGRGALIVYSQSMEDGSHQNEVRIPVRFASD